MTKVNIRTFLPNDYNFRTISDFRTILKISGISGISRQLGGLPILDSIHQHTDMMVGYCQISKDHVVCNTTCVLTATDTAGSNSTVLSCKT